MQGDRFAGCQDGFPARRGDGTAVADLLPGQHNVAAFRRRQAALVHHLCAGITVAAQRVLPVHKVRGTEVLRGGHQTAHVHPCVFPEQHPVGVEDEHLTIGLQGPHNL